MEAYFNGVKLTNANISITTTIEDGNRIDITDNSDYGGPLQDVVKKVASGKMVLIDADAVNKTAELAQENKTLKHDIEIYKMSSMSQATRIAEFKTANELLQDLVNRNRAIEELHTTMSNIYNSIEFNGNKLITANHRIANDIEEHKKYVEDVTDSCDDDHSSRDTNISVG